MKNLFKVLAMLTLLFAPAQAANAQVSFGITIGPPPRLRPSRVGPMPGPGYEWVDGYWYPVGSRWAWHAGYWTRPPFDGAYWVQPYYSGGRYIPGYWDGGRGRFDHDHRWDRGRQRDERRGDRRDDHRDDRRDNRRDDRR
jgi:hypothetical protein